jgi:hypothetical protein
MGTQAGKTKVNRRTGVSTVAAGAGANARRVGAKALTGLVGAAASTRADTAPKKARPAAGGVASSLHPTIARTDLVDKVVRARMESEIDAALARKAGSEAKLAGALRAVGALSPGLRIALAEVADTMIRRGSFRRELYGAALRTIAEAGDTKLGPLLKSALGSDEAGGTPALSAACFSNDVSLGALLAKLAASRQSHLAFSAETARVVRGEANGQFLAALAPMIKESHRIALCAEFFMPLMRRAPAPLGVAQALFVLRGAERHLGRWLILAEIAAKAGDRGPLEEARTKATSGPHASRAAWSFVAWALESAAGPAPHPTARPSVELIARLSDRPSADRDPTFLFRMARAGAPVAKAMLEAFVRGVPLSDEASIRAALYLARDHGRDDLREALVQAAGEPKREELRGVAMAALWDAGEYDRARALADELVESKHLGNVAWSALVRAAAGRSRDKGAVGARPGDVLEENALRWIQWGSIE